MELGFENRLDAAYDVLEERYRSIMETAFELLNIKTNYEVDVSLVDEDTIHQINRDYRNVDRVTDVISFAFNDDKSKEGLILGDEIPHMLGEIFVCVPRALEQAKQIGNTPERELNFLFCHGLLHLLGYDHMKKEDEEIMFPLQDKILDAVKEKESK
jgi:probable rRNA maturation factor